MRHTRWLVLILSLALALSGCAQPGGSSVPPGSPGATPGAAGASPGVAPALPATTTGPEAAQPAATPSASALAAHATPASALNVAPAATKVVQLATSIAGQLRPGLPAFSHVFIILLENREASEIVGNKQAAYLNQLASQYARAANYYGIGHPSLPNYLALTGGDTFGIQSDCTDCFLAKDNLANQVERAGRAWKGYMESLPGPCFKGAGDGGYALKHDPFMYYDNIRNDPARCNRVVPLTQLDADLQSGTVPDLAWISPNLCNDMHDCPVATGDAWLRTWVPKILNSPAWKQDGVLFITFDEGGSTAGCCQVAAGGKQVAAGGKVDTLVISPLVQPGFVSQVAYDHYSLLRTIEEAWGLPRLGNAGCDCSAPMADFFRPHK